MVYFLVCIVIFMVLLSWIAVSGLLYIEVWDLFLNWLHIVLYSAMLSLPNPSDNKLQMDKCVHIYLLINMHFHNNKLLPCMYISEGSIWIMWKAIYGYWTGTWVYSWLLPKCVPAPLALQLCIYCKVTLLLVKHAFAKSPAQLPVGLQS